MKRNFRFYKYKHYGKIEWDDDLPQEEPNTLGKWPKVKSCVELYYKAHPEMKQYHRTERQPIEFRCTDRFIKSLNKHCTTGILKLKLLDALTRKVYQIPSSGLRDTPIKERSDLWHFYVSDSWRVFYRKKNNYILLEEFCPHKKMLYYRRC